MRKLGHEAFLLKLDPQLWLFLPRQYPGQYLLLVLRCHQEIPVDIFLLLAGPLIELLEVYNVQLHENVVGEVRLLDLSPIPGQHQIPLLEFIRILVLLCFLIPVSGELLPHIFMPIFQEPHLFLGAHVLHLLISFFNRFLVLFGRLAFKHQVLPS